MPFDPADLNAAQRAQDQAARDLNSRVRLIAGPGTGKSRSIAIRVNFLLNRQVPPSEIAVISFTRASARDLRTKVDQYCSHVGNGALAAQVDVSTMHSLALKILASANLLVGMFPSKPKILDDWEQKNIFDAEFSYKASVTPGRASQIRRAYDASWQTLQSLQSFGAKPPTSLEQTAFTAYQPTAKAVYSCLLPGEVVRTCVDEMRTGNISQSHLPAMSHLIVDEYQDLNECDQEFVQRIASFGTSLFIAGDDDQSIYSFRFSAPAGLQNFMSSFPTASPYQLQHCFRCTPAVLSAASALMSHAPSRIPKTVVSMYQSAQPPVTGAVQVWRFNTGVQEARAIAESCRDLIAAGVGPNDILILVRTVPVQAALLLQELQRVVVPAEPPRGGWLLEEPMPRLAHSLFQIIQDPGVYVSYRVILGLSQGVGPNTCAQIADKTVAANLNFRDLFYRTRPNGVFSSREETALKKVEAVIQQISSWAFADTFAARAAAIDALGWSVFGSGQPGNKALADWNTLTSTLPPGMTLEELFAFLSSDTEAGRLKVLDATIVRLGISASSQASSSPNPADRVRLLTMHGAKGLEGKVVFIPGLEQGIIPTPRAIRSAGLVNEERRLLYTSLARARGICILSLSSMRVGRQALVLSNGKEATSSRVRSQFLTEIGAPIAQRSSGLTAQEVALIVQDAGNL